MIGLDGKMDFERLAAVYDAIYGTRENRVSSSAPRSRNTTTRLLKGFNPFAVDANQGRHGRPVHQGSSRAYSRGRRRCAWRSTAQLYCA